MNAERARDVCPNIIPTSFPPPDHGTPRPRAQSCACAHFERGKKIFTIKNTRVLHVLTTRTP